MPPPLEFAVRPPIAAGKPSPGIVGTTHCGSYLVMSYDWGCGGALWVFLAHTLTPGPCRVTPIPVCQTPPWGFS